MSFLKETPVVEQRCLNKLQQNINIKNKQYENEYSEEKFFKKLTKCAKKVGAKLVYYALILYYVLQDPAVPAKYKAAIVGALGYFIFMKVFIISKNEETPPNSYGCR